MRGRSRAGSVKSGRRKAAAPKRASGTGTARSRSSSAGAQESDVARLSRELAEARQQQTATADVLRIISSSSDSLERVFETILEKAVRICESKFANLLLLQNDGFRMAAMYGAPAEFEEAFAREPILRPSAPALSVLRTKAIVHIPDMRAQESYSTLRLATLGGARTLLTVPMLKGKELVGAIAIYRQQIRPFSDTQIELMQNFAAQAVIAIENARLLNELRQSLEQQTATANVLHVISSSPGDLQPVFEVMLQNAVRVCDAKFGTLFRFDGKSFHFVEEVGTPPELAEWHKQRGPFLPLPGSNLERAIQTQKVCHSADVVTEGIPSVAGRLGGARSVVCVPMLKDRVLVGAMTIYRQEVRPFTDKQIKLVKNFAAQAVIAIENTRLLNELRERSEEVVKLNQQLEQRVADQVGEIERMGRLRRFLPPQVADLIVASGTENQLESHRREITALFCDLRGFTGFSESSDPEDVMALLRDYHEAIGRIIIKYGGTLERFAGDGVMVIFNDPVPVENPALQAVLMALDMRAEIGTLIERWRMMGHELGFGIGIAHGFATLGTIGFEGRRDYAAIGTVSNVASRLCDEAKPGQILISPRVMLAVDKAVTVEQVGEFTLKGIRRPMMTYNVLEPLPSKSN